MNMYIYIYIYVYVYMHMYIYIYSPSRVPRSLRQPAASSNRGGEGECALEQEGGGHRENMERPAPSPVAHVSRFRPKQEQCKGF